MGVSILLNNRLGWPIFILLQGIVFLVFSNILLTDATPKSRRTAEAVYVTKFRNRSRKSVTFCRKCGRKIPPERSRNGWGLSAVPTSSRPPLCRRPFKRGATTAISFRLKIVYDGNSDRARSFAQNALCLVGCFFDYFVWSQAKAYRMYTALFLPATLGSRRRLALPRPLPHIFIYLFT